MFESRLLRGAVSVGLLGALAIAVVYISSLSPIVLDMWGSVARGVRSKSSIDFLTSSFEAYGQTYLRGNPRIGQLFLFLSGASNPARIFVNFISVAALVAAAFTIITGRLFRPWRLGDALAAILFLSLLWIVQRALGQVLFYMPFTTNYLLAYAIVLAFLVPYRLALLQPSFPAERWLTFTLPLLGVAAGLTNEHTPPVYIAMIGAALALLPMSAQRWRWMASGLAGLVVGFAMLVFAPGQSRRYDGAKYEGMEFDIGGKLDAAGEIFYIFIAKGWALAMLAGIAAAAAILCFRRAGWAGLKASQRDALIVAALLVIAAIGMMALLLMSPIIVYRLFFAPHVNLAMATTAVLLAISAAPAWRAFLGVAALGVCAFFFSRAYLAYSAYHGQFAEHVASVQSQKATGASSVVMPDYTLKFNSLSKFVYRDPCHPDKSDYPNPYKAMYFGVQFVTMDCPQH